MTDDSTKPDYEVGRGKPPRDTQFKKGQSGNPKGRPRKKKKQSAKAVRNFYDALSQELERIVPVTEQGVSMRISVYQALAKRLVAEGFKGNMVALKTLLTLAEEAKTKKTFDIPDDETMASMSLERVAETYRRVMRSGY